MMAATRHTRIKNIIFDLGHVFIKIDTTRLTVFRAFSQLSKQYGNYKSTAEIGNLFNEKEINDRVVAFHYGKISSEEFRTVIRKKLGLSVISDKEFDEAWNASILASPFEVKERLQYLEELKQLGYQTFLLSNNNAIHRIHSKTYYQGNDWDKYFIKQYYSNETGNYKPDSVAFAQVLIENDLRAEETIFFDDVLKNVEAAWSAGIHARQFSIHRPMSDIMRMINAIEDTLTKGMEVNRISTLGMFAFNKWNEKKDLGSRHENRYRLGLV